MAKPSSEYINSMHANAKRRRLRTGTDAVVPDNDGGQSYSELVVIGYTERGIPLYEKKCLSNDNANPYSGDCTDDVAVEDVDVDGDGDGDGDGGDTTSYAYECVSNCNTHAPGNSYDLGWTFVGTCRMDADCPDAYDANDESYVTGDKVAVSSDYMNGKVIGSVSCPRGEESSDDLMKKNSTVLVPYAYEVETSKVSTADVFLPRLEEQILLNLADTLMSCLGGGQAQDGVRFDVRGIESSPDDVTVTEGPCSISSDGADNCFMINGGITLILVPVDDGARVSGESAMAATDEAQTKIETSMDGDDLLSPKMPEVIKVKYLDDSYEDYLAGLSGGSSSLPASNGDEGGGGGGSLDLILGLIFGSLLLLILLVLCCVRLRRRDKSESGPDGNVGSGSGIGDRNLMDDMSSVNGNGHYGSPGIFAALGTMGSSVGGLLRKKNEGNGPPDHGKNKSAPDSPGTEPEEESDDGLDDIIDQIDGATDANDRRIFVVDPPGAFHLGNHHYTGDGVRYFSPLCELCIAARANADGVVCIKAVDADDDDDSENGDMNLSDRNNGLSFDLEAASKFTDFNSNDLGMYHSSMHVRTCKSTTCPICIKKKGVYFVKSRGSAGAR